MQSRFIAMVLLALQVVAQEGKQHFLLNNGTPEGQIIQSIIQETDDAKKLALAEDFLAKYPKNEGAGCVTVRLQLVYLTQEEYDKALDAVEKALANGPNDVDVSYYWLEAADGES